MGVTESGTVDITFFFTFLFVFLLHVGVLIMNLFAWDGYSWTVVTVNITVSKWNDLPSQS